MKYWYFPLLVKDVVVDFHPMMCELNSIQWRGNWLRHIDFSKFRFSTVSLPVLEKDISGSEWAFRGRFFGFSVLYQTLATWYVHIAKIFPKIWCKTTQPKKSYKRPKLRSLHFGWEFWYMVTLKKCFWNKQLELRHGKGCNRSATTKYVAYHILRFIRTLL